MTPHFPTPFTSSLFTSSLFNSALTLALALLCFPSLSSAQSVIADANAQPSEVVLESTRDEAGAHLDVKHLLLESRSTVSVAGGFASAYGSTRRYLCSTPCRLRVDQPIRVSVAGLGINLEPTGRRERILVRPARVGLKWFGGIFTFLGINALLGGVSAGVLAPRKFEIFDNEADRLLVRNWSYAGLITGAVLLVVGTLVMRRGIARYDRVAF